MKRFWSVILACMLAFCCSVLPASAIEVSINPSAISRVSGRLNQNIPAKTIAYMGDEFSLVSGDIVSYNCAYTPKSASVDFGFVAPDGLFYSLNSTSGSINKSIKVSQTGMFTLAIRNNASYAVTVTGTVKY